MTTTITPPDSSLVHVGFVKDAPIFRPKNGSTPPPPHLQLEYQHHNELGAPVFRQPPRKNPHLEGMPIRRPLWEQDLHDRTDKFSSLLFPEKGWRPLCDRARKVAKYYEQHRGSPGLPKRAWDEQADKLNEIREVEPFVETSLPALAANEIERMTRSTLEPTADSKRSFPIAGATPQPPITVRPISRAAGGKYASAPKPQE